MLKQPRQMIHFAAVGLALSLSGPVMAGPVIGQGTWETTLQARDVNHDGIQDAYYDTSLNVTWLADAFADGPPPGHLPGRPILFLSEAETWAATLNVFGVTGWRLPKAIDDPKATGIGTRSCPPETLDGTSHGLCGYNSDPTQSELVHMYYVTLGNKAPLGPDGTPQAGAGLTNTGPFEQLLPKAYWTNTQHNPGDFVWTFRMDIGQQNVSDPVGGLSLGTWAVHDGDIAAVPEPESLAMIGAGMLTLLALRRRRQ